MPGRVVGKDADPGDPLEVAWVAEYSPVGVKRVWSFFALNAKCTSYGPIKTINWWIKRLDEGDGSVEAACRPVISYRAKVRIPAMAGRYKVRVRVYYVDEHDARHVRKGEVEMTIPNVPSRV